MQGNISGVGIVMLGQENNTTTNINSDANAFGTIRIEGNNTYSGGTVLRQGRFQIDSNSPFGTGSLAFGPSGFGNQGVLEAFGTARTITNTLSAISWNGNTVLEFDGHNSLSFTSNAERLQHGRECAGESHPLLQRLDDPRRGHASAAI